MLVPPVVTDDAEGAALFVRLELLLVCCARVGVLHRQTAASKSELLLCENLGLLRFKISIVLESLLEVVFKGCGALLHDY